MYLWSNDFLPSNKQTVVPDITNISQEMVCTNEIIIFLTLKKVVLSFSAFFLLNFDIWPQNEFLSSSFTSS